MTAIWHLVKNDLRRLRLPVALLSLLTLGKIVLYAAIGGLFRAPDLEWLNRLQSGPELLLRTLVEPLVAYLLVGWLVFEDSPVEKDAHWITRPISGLQLFAAKLAGAVGMFVLLPLAINVSWWLAGGFDGPQIAVAAAELAAAQSVLVAMGLVCASLTDGFPRFVLWSLVGLGSFALGQVILLSLGDPGAGLAVSRLMVWCLGGSVVALALAVHQFATRRHRKSVTLALAGIFALGALGGAWRWNLTNIGGPRLVPEGDDSQGMRLKIAGPAHYLHMGERHFAQLTLQIGGIPADTNVAQIRAAGEWSVNGPKIWSSRVNMTSAELTKEAIQRILGLKAPRPAEGEATLSFPFSPQIVQRTAREAVAFHASIDLDLFHGKIVAELPLREEAAPRGGRAYTISHLFNGPLKESRPGKTAATGSAPAQNALSLVLTERSADGLVPLAFARRSITFYALVNRGTGEFFLHNPARSGPTAITTLNQARVGCWQLTFLTGPAPVRMEEMVLVVIRFSDGELIKRTLDVDAVLFAEGQSDFKAGAERFAGFITTNEE